ncbi:MAG: hypothetical protein JJE09_08510 [Bacteroidia bacterium]|nr:hypothetical protein [Bacteroidia bacterium]
MAGLSLNVLRTGKKYSLINFGDRYEFIIENILSNGDFILKDLHTLEKYHYKDLIKFGKSRDFEIRDL